FDQAVEAYDKAIQLRPFYSDAHVGLGDARAAKGEVDAAVAAYQKALLYNPANPRVYMSLGKIYYSEKGLYYESVNAYKKAIDLDPQSVDARMGLGEVYEDKGLYREAIDEYKKVMEVDAKHTGALYNLALVYEKVDPKEAIVQWERYIALASPLPSEKDWVDVARQHLRKLKGQVKEQPGRCESRVQTADLVSLRHPPDPLRERGGPEIATVLGRTHPHSVEGAGHDLLESGDDLRLPPEIVLKALDPFEVRHHHAAGIGEDVGDDGHAPLAEDLI